MSRPDALREVRIGCVQYLNSRPLIHGLEDVFLAHPRELAAQLRAGRIDAALVPVFELLRAPGDYRVVDGVAISSDGPVYSVYVAHRRPLEELTAVTADPASLTSVHLFKVLAAGALKRELPLVNEGEQFGGVEDLTKGRLLIGNQAIAHRLRQESAGEMFWDLGEAWTRWSGLPFVYAVWVLRRDLAGVNAVADAFREVAHAGKAAIGEIARAETEFGAELALRYLSEQIRFELGAAEHSGLARFSSELEKMGLVAAGRPRLDVV